MTHVVVEGVEDSAVASGETLMEIEKSVQTGGKRDEKRGVHETMLMQK